jgi:RecA-family ATPase
MSKGEKIFTLEETLINKFMKKKIQLPKYLIQHLIPDQKLTLLASAGGVGKTQVTSQLSFSVATGEKFLGKFEVNKMGKVLIISTEEDRSEIAQRIKQIETHHLNSIDDPEERKAEKKRIRKLLKKNIRVAYVGADPSFVLSPDENDINRCRILRFCKQELKSPPSLIVIDNQSQLMLGEHNSASAAAIYMRQLVSIMKEVGCAIINLAHTNKASARLKLDQRLSAESLLGSASYINIPRLVLTMTRVKAGEVVIPEHPKPRQIVAIKAAKTNIGGVLEEIIFMNRCSDGVLDYLPLPQSSPDFEYLKIMKFVEENEGMNQSNLSRLLIEEEMLTKNESINLLKRAVNQSYLRIEKGENNAKLYYVNKSKLKELTKTLKEAA